MALGAPPPATHAEPDEARLHSHIYMHIYITLPPKIPAPTIPILALGAPPPAPSHEEPDEARAIHIPRALFTSRARYSHRHSQYLHTLSLYDDVSMTAFPHTVRRERTRPLPTLHHRAPPSSQSASPSARHGAVAEPFELPRPHSHLHPDVPAHSLYIATRNPSTLRPHSIHTLIHTRVHTSHHTSNSHPTSHLPPSTQMDASSPDTKGRVLPLSPSFYPAQRRSSCADLMTDG